MMAVAQPWPRQRQARQQVQWMRSWCVLPAVLGKLPLQQAAQQVGHGHALREGRYLDARPHGGRDVEREAGEQDRKSTRLNSSHRQISYSVFCFEKKKHQNTICLTHTP